MKSTVLSILYFVIGILYISLMTHLPSYPATALKSTLVPFLIVILLLNLKDRFNRISILLLAGLIFSLAGDMSIEFSFIAGLGFFMAAQIMYLVAFISTKGDNVILGGGKFALIPVVIYGAGLILFLYGDLDGMRLPVIIYAVVILSMLISAINRLKKVNRLSYWLVFAGAVLFVLSDSSIAVNRFSFQFKSSGWIIMSTYLLAQYLITVGYIRQYRNSLI